MTSTRSAGVSAAGLLEQLSGLSISSLLALSLGDALTCDLPQILGRFCGRSSELAQISCLCLWISRLLAQGLRRHVHANLVERVKYFTV